MLTGFQLTGERAGVVEEVYRFCESVGLPTTLEDIGVRNASAADLLAVANRACVEEESIHHEAIDGHAGEGRGRARGRGRRGPRTEGAGVTAPVLR